MKMLLTSLALATLASLAASQTTHVVNQISLTFSPAAITIDVGDSVRWIHSVGTHTVTEGTDDVFTPGVDAFNYLLSDANPVVQHLFDGRFLFENPRPGNVYPYVCIPHLAFAGMAGSVTVDSPYENLGFAKAGSLGDPILYGNGSLEPGSSSAFVLEDANPNSFCILFVGLTEGNAAFFGGTLVPVPILLEASLFTSPTGTLPIPFVTPAGATGLEMYLQYAIADPGALFGVSLSNAVKATFQ